MTNPEMARRGRLGALATLATHDVVALTQAARDTYRASFANHAGCAMCGHPAPVQLDLPEAERTRRAACLRRSHYLRLARLPRARGRRAA